MLSKIRYDRVDKLLYQGSLENGMNMVIAPMINSIDKVYFGLNLSVGGYAREYTIDGSKIPVGTIEIFAECLKKNHPAEAEPLFDNKCKFDIVIYESYTSFEVECQKEDFFVYYSALLSLLSEFKMKNDEVEAVKEKYVRTLSPMCSDDTVNIRSSLYVAAPMKHSIRGTKESLKAVHLITLKKFYEVFIRPEYLTVFVVGGVDVEKTYNIANALKFKKVTEARSIDVKPYREDRKAIVSYKEKGKEENHLTLGIKFPRREGMFKKFSNDVFLYYLLLSDILFTKSNSIFASKVTSYVTIDKIALYEGAEEAYLAVSFQTGDKEKLISEIEEYLSLDKLITRRDFSKAKKSLLVKYANIYKQDPKTYYGLLLNAYANSYAHTALVQNAYKVRYGKFDKFLDEVKTFAHAYLD